MKLCLQNTSREGCLAHGIQQIWASSHSRHLPRKGSPEPPLGSPEIMSHLASLVLCHLWVCKLGPHVCPMKTYFQMSPMGLTSAAVLCWFLILVQPRPLGFGEWPLAPRSCSLACGIYLHYSHSGFILFVPEPTSTGTFLCDQNKSQTTQDLSLCIACFLIIFPPLLRCHTLKGAFPYHST